MTWGELAEFAALAAGGLAVLYVIRMAVWAAFVARVAKAACPGCNRPFGRPPALAAISYDERMCGPEAIVFRKRGFHARVVRCSGCGEEWLFGELGRCIGPLAAGPDGEPVAPADGGRDPGS